MSISTEKMLQYLFLMEQYRIFVPQRRNIMVLFIISYLLKEQIVGGRNFLFRSDTVKGNKTKIVVNKS
jgi:hypothetical protein